MVVFLSIGLVTADDAIRDIEGYIDWCERGVRSRIHGTLTSAGVCEFSITPTGTALLGPPDSISWLHSLTFTGTVCEGRLRGSYTR